MSKYIPLFYMDMITNPWLKIPTLSNLDVYLFREMVYQSSGLLPCCVMSHWYISDTYQQAHYWCNAVNAPDISASTLLMQCRNIPAILTHNHQHQLICTITWIVNKHSDITELIGVESIDIFDLVACTEFNSLASETVGSILFLETWN